MGTGFAKAQSTFTGKPMYNVAVKRAGIPIGSFNIELFPNIAPKHARNFDSLVSQNFYDTTAFHRVIPGFMIQGGDPNSRHGPVNTWGFGQPGQPTVPAEFSKAKHLRGILSAARQANNINSATSQFFICVATAAHLDGNYSVYGRVIANMNIVDTIVLAPRNAQDRPNLKHEMFITYLGSNDTIPKAPELLYPKKDSVGIDSAWVVQLKWKTVSDAILYQVEVSVDSTFAMVDSAYTTASPVASFKNMSGNTRYYWRARTNNGGHYSPWTALWNFHTAGETTGLATEVIVKQELSVFPNPGQNTFTFINAGEGNLVQIFDENARLISVTPGQAKYTVVTLNNRAKGLYTYKVVKNNLVLAEGKLICE